MHSFRTRYVTIRNLTIWESQLVGINPMSIGRIESPASELGKTVTVKKVERTEASENIMVNIHMQILTDRLDVRDSIAAGPIVSGFLFFTSRERAELEWRERYGLNHLSLDIL
jgi:hypothetical protein